MDRRVVVTGGAGFIGSHLTDFHINQQDHVTVVDNFSTGETRDTSGSRDVLSLDLSTKRGASEIERELAQADIVYHMAGSVGVKYVDKDPKWTLLNSFNINNNLFPLFEKHNNRVIFASTSEVYGNTEEAHETDELKIGSPDTLRWGYACAKLMSEFLLKAYSMPSTIARFFNVTGSGQLSKHGMVLPTFVKLAKANEDMIIYGDGQQYRSFCDVRDACEMINIISGDDHVGEIYNVGNSSNTINILDLATMVKSILNSDSNIILRDYKQDFSSEHGEIFQRRPNTSKMDQYYVAHHSIEDIIKSMI